LQSALKVATSFPLKAKSVSKHYPKRMTTSDGSTNIDCRTSPFVKIYPNESVKLVKSSFLAALWFFDTNKK